MSEELHIQQALDYIKFNSNEGFVCDEASIINESLSEKREKSTLLIKISSILGGVLATLAFNGFLFVAGLFHSQVALLGFGLISIIAALWISKKTDKLLYDTLCISMYAIGFVLIATGLIKLHPNENLIPLTFIVLAGLGLIFTRNYVLTFISILIVSGSLLSFILINKCYEIIHVYNAVFAILMSFWILKEARILSSKKILLMRYDPVRIGLVFSFVFGFLFLGIKGLVPLSENLIWSSSVINIVLILWVSSQILKVLTIESRAQKLMIQISVTVLLLLTALSPAISGSILIMLLCFWVNHKTGLVVGMVSLIYFISQFYYDLSISLLVKSIILFASGVLFLALYWFSLKKFGGSQ